jgi:hypothetical protein
MKKKSLYLCAAIVLISFASCKKDAARQPDLTYNPVISSANFTSPTNLTNPYFPATPGKKYVYEGQTSEGLEHIEEQRLTSTKTILGITCIEVEFKAFLNGKLIERALDWYAQDNSGVVWYFGEAVDNYNTNGTLKDHNGSWEAGVDGAKPGTIMPANPQAGMPYREEYYFNHAEDRAEITGTGLTVTISFGNYTNCIKTRNWTELEPDLNENKFYAPGIGLVKEVDMKDNSETSLIAIQ